MGLSKLKHIFSLQAHFGDHITNLSDESEETSCSINDIDVEYLLTTNEIDDEEPESQMTTINTEQYKYLMQLIPQVEKLKDVIKQMEKKIKSKDSKLKELQRIHKNGQWVDLTELSNVSIFYQIKFLILLFSVEKQESEKWLEIGI